MTVSASVVSMTIEPPEGRFDFGFISFATSSSIL